MPKRKSKSNSGRFDINFTTRKQISAEKMTNEDSVVLPEHSGQREIMTESENRDYVLNTDKAMQKKLIAVDESVFTLTETSGGTVLKLNAGMYELFKEAANDYFSNDTLQFNSSKTVVYDKKRNVVEVRYRVEGDSGGHYTLNMYNTTCNCLINGKNSVQFIEKDVIGIFDHIQQSLEKNDCTIHQFNQNVRNMLVTFCENSSQTRCSPSKSNKNDVQEVASVLECENPCVSPDLLCDDNITVINKECCSAETQTETPQYENFLENNLTVTGADLYKILLNVNLSVRQLQNTLDTHIEECGQHFTKLRDEIVSLKKQYSLRSDVTEQAVSELSTKTERVHSNIDAVSLVLQRKVQSMFDMLKVIDKKDRISVKKQNKQKRIVEETGRTESIANLEENNDNENTVRKVIHVESESDSESDREDVQIDDRREKVSTRTNGPRAPVTMRKVLIIGDSILKGIDVKGLNKDVDVTCLRGGKVADVLRTIKEVDMRCYAKVVVYVGGNDVANGEDVFSIYGEMKSLLKTINKDKCEVKLCSLAPRVDVDVTAINDTILQLCGDMKVGHICVYPAFTYGNGLTVKNYFQRDNIHLSRSGTSNLLRVINEEVTIMTNMRGRYTDQGPRVSYNNRRYPKTPARLFQPRGYYSNSGRHRVPYNGYRYRDTNVENRPRFYSY